MEDILIINKSVRKGYRLDVHGKESCGAIRKSNLSCKSTLVPENKARDTKCKHETNCGKVEDDMTVETLDISDDEVNRKMKMMTTTTMATKMTEMATTRKGKAGAMRTK